MVTVHVPDNLVLGFGPWIHNSPFVEVQGVSTELNLVKSEFPLKPHEFQLFIWSITLKIRLKSHNKRILPYKTVQNFRIDSG